MADETIELAVNSISRRRKAKQTENMLSLEIDRAVIAGRSGKRMRNRMGNSEGTTRVYDDQGNHLKRIERRKRNEGRACHGAHEPNTATGDGLEEGLLNNEPEGPGLDAGRGGGSTDDPNLQSFENDVDELDELLRKYNKGTGRQNCRDWQDRIVERDENWAKFRPSIFCDSLSSFYLEPDTVR